MEYRLTREIEEAVTPPFDFMKFYSAIHLLQKNIESINMTNALDNYMNIHVLASWISDHIGEVNAIPSTAKEFAKVIKTFGRSSAVDGEFHSSNGNHSVRPNVIVSSDEVFLEGKSMTEVYALLEDAQDPYAEKILAIVEPFKGKMLWHSGAIHMTPPQY